jgi:Subtilase family
MNTRAASLSLVVLVLLAGCSSAGTTFPDAVHPLGSQPYLGANAGASVTAKAACPAATRGFGQCHGIQRTDAGEVDATDDAAFMPFYEKKCYRGDAVCYTPKDLWKAYDLPAQTNGAGQTIALVDAYDDPTAVTDLAIYRKKFQLPPCTEKDQCFRKVGQTGSPFHLPKGDSWRGEESLDIDMASAVCPKCHIILMEATTNRFSDFAVAENEAVALGATVISNSWSGPEWAPSDPAYDHPGVAITASAGDNGYDTCASRYGCAGPQEPAAFASVIAVGGTTMLPDSSNRGFSERAWNCYNDGPGACDVSTIFATGSGCSAMVRKPAWENDTGCTTRSYNDVAAVADVITGVLIVVNGHWQIWGGTSVASPIVAASIALAGNAKTLHGAKEIWKSNGANFFDVTKGENIVRIGGTSGSFSPVCAPAYRYVCRAGEGYDGPTGWGTPDGVDGL